MSRPRRKAGWSPERLRCSGWGSQASWAHLQRMHKRVLQWWAPGWGSASLQSKSYVTMIRPRWRWESGGSKSWNRCRLMDLLMEEQCADRGALANPVGDQGSEMVATAMDLSIRSIFRSPFESRIQIYPRSYRLLGTFYFSNEKKVRWRSLRRERNERSRLRKGFVVVVARRVGVVTEENSSRDFWPGSSKGTVPPMEGVGRDLGLRTSNKKRSPGGLTLGRVEMLPLNEKNRRNIVGNGLGGKNMST